MKAVKLSADMLQAIDGMQEDVLALIKALCAIPAPSHHEERRAAYIKEWFEKQGMHAWIDEALNVLCPMGVEDKGEIVVIMAHTDTVFPDMEPMPMREEAGKLYCPGVGDDTTNLAAMMMLAVHLHNMQMKPRCGVLFVANSCEEGLGNLKGCKAIMKAYGPRVKAFLSLDCGYEGVYSSAVGSSRYRITAKTRGGHSYENFGNRNAIAALAKIITALYTQDVPAFEGTKTTYNVGVIEGGTSVNTIAQQAHMLYEFRSDDARCLQIMEEQMRSVLAENTAEDVQLDVELLGLRPCGRGVDPARQAALEAACCEAIRTYTGFEPETHAASTDCNVPLSMGIPSACFGVYMGEGAHTREEWVDIASICPGMKAAASVILGFFE